MKIVSTAFENEGEIPAKYTCDGANTNPPLTIEDLPGGTKSIAIIVDDPDSVGGSWTHWTIWNIHPDYSRINENETPPMATEGVNDFGNYGYGGPCPSHGVHHYRFHVYALSRDLMLNPDSNREYVQNSMHGLILGEAELVGTYTRD